MESEKILIKDFNYKVDKRIINMTCEILNTGIKQILRPNSEFTIWIRFESGFTIWHNEVMDSLYYRRGYERIFIDKDNLTEYSRALKRMKMENKLSKEDSSETQIFTSDFHI